MSAIMRLMTERIDGNGTTSSPNLTNLNGVYRTPRFAIATVYGYSYTLSASGQAGAGGSGGYGINAILDSGFTGDSRDTYTIANDALGSGPGTWGGPGKGERTEFAVNFWYSHPLDLRLWTTSYWNPSQGSFQPMLAFSSGGGSPNFIWDFTLYYG